MPTIPQTLTAAVQYHQGGHWQAAEMLYRQVLQADPYQADAWHLLGVLAWQVGNPQNGIEYLQRAVQLRPDFTEAHFNLGSVLQSQGRVDEAVACYRRALELKPDYPDAYNNLGIALRDRGKVDEAVACYQQTLRLNPNHAQAHSNLGDGLRVQGKPDEAAACCRRALELMPNLADAHNNLGNALQEQGRLDEAVACYRHALQLQPHFAGAHNNLCTALQEQGKLDEAAACYRHALQLHPHLAEAHNNLGTVLQDQGKFDEAVACHRRALELNPNYADAHTSLGKVLGDQGKVDEALACYERALQLKPNCAEAHLSRSLLWLLLGNFAQGWPEYEWRWRRKDLTLPRFPQPPWDGTPVPGRTVFLHTEQGFGDTLQFIRYATLVKERAGRVIVGCDPALLALLGSCPGIDQLVAPGSPLPPFDFHAPLLSLPRLLGTATPDSIPAQVPYLSAPAEQVARWRHKLAGLDGFKVGLCWQGSPSNKRDRLRSVRLEQLAPLAGVPGVRLFSLQKGAGAEQLEAVRERWGMIDLTHQFESWADTAAAVSALDLVVTVETAVAHLAGALGKPALVLLPMSPDWRWPPGRENSPWYPSLRLFRQRHWGDWPEVIARVAAALSAAVRKGDRES